MELTNLEVPRERTFVGHWQIRSTLSKTDTTAETGTGNSVLLRQMLKRESDKGSKGGKGPIVGVRFPEMTWFLACLSGRAPIKEVKLRRKSSLAITKEVRRTHKIKQPAPQEGSEKQI